MCLFKTRLPLNTASCRFFFSPSALCSQRSAAARAAIAEVVGEDGDLPRLMGAEAAAIAACKDSSQRRRCPSRVFDTREPAAPIARPPTAHGKPVFPCCAGAGSDQSSTNGADPVGGCASLRLWTEDKSLSEISSGMDLKRLRQYV